MASRIAVMGATGYTALELLKLLVRHPEAEIVSLTTRQENRPHVSDVHPELRGRLDLHLETHRTADFERPVESVMQLAGSLHDRETITLDS